MSPDLLIGIGIAVLVIIVALAIRFMNRPKEIGIAPYSNHAPIAETPKYASDTPRPSGDFRFMIEDVFNIKGRGIVVTGRIESGDLRIGERVRISDGINTYETTIKGIESFRQKRASATVGDNVGLLLADLSKEEVKQGMLLSSIA
jgi:translation elongation factor EF-Tu-like GTPase